MDFKREIYNHALEIQANGGFPPFPSGFGKNCLPVCRALMPFVKKRLPTARLVIGYAGVELTSSTQLEKEIIDFSNATGDLKVTCRPEFHAWIELESGDTFDITAAVSMLADRPHRGYIDAADAANFGFEYFPVLTDERDVERFYEKLRTTVSG